MPAPLTGPKAVHVNRGGGPKEVDHGNDAGDAAYGGLSPAAILGGNAAAEKHTADLLTVCFGQDTSERRLIVKTNAFHGGSREQLVSPDGSGHAVLEKDDIRLLLSQMLSRFACLKAAGRMRV
jgi:hypothetical protein